jgi:hypothetical protein
VSRRDARHAEVEGRASEWPALAIVGLRRFEGQDDVGLIIAVCLNVPEAPFCFEASPVLQSV